MQLGPVSNVYLFIMKVSILKLKENITYDFGCQRYY